MGIDVFISFELKIISFTLYNFIFLMLVHIPKINKRKIFLLHMFERKIIISFLDNMVRKQAMSQWSMWADGWTTARLTVPMVIIRERILNCSMINGI